MSLRRVWSRMTRWIVALSSLGTASCSSKAADVRSISAREAYDLVRTDRAVLVDVREEGEVRNGMAEPARWFATTRAEDAAAWNEFVAGLPRDKEIVLYCARGGRSQKVARKLVMAGFRASSSGGYGDWTDAGLPTRRPF